VAFRDFLQGGRPFETPAAETKTLTAKAERYVSAALAGGKTGEGGAEKKKPADLLGMLVAGAGGAVSVLAFAGGIVNGLNNPNAKGGKSAAKNNEGFAPEEIPEALPGQTAEEKDFWQEFDSGAVEEEEDGEWLVDDDEDCAL
jgi:hypothetical protein